MSCGEVQKNLAELTANSVLINVDRTLIPQLDKLSHGSTALTSYLTLSTV